MNHGIVSRAILAVLAAGCASSRPVVKVDELVAPLDPELAHLPGARALWMPDEEFGGMIYVVVVDPPGGASSSTLVLVHGLGKAGVRDFYSVIGQLARGRRVVAFDLPGFGRSGRANEEYTPARYAAVVARVIEAHARGPVDVLGHSMGGAIALMYAGTHAEKVRRLVLVDAAGILYREAWFGHHLRRVTDPAGLVFPGPTSELNKVVDTVFRATRVFDIVPGLILGTAGLRQRVLDGEPGSIAALGLILTDFSDAIAAVRAPTLVVWGGDDVVAPPRTGQLLEDRLRDARLRVLNGVGHNVMAEAPTRLIAAVEPFLDAAAVQSEPAPAPEPSRGNVACAGQADLRLAGTYDDVVLDGCDNVTLDHVSMRRLAMKNSSARLAHTTVSAGVTLASSRLIATGGALAGDLVVDLVDSNVDLAGVSLDAGRQVVRLAGTSKAVFSVCPVRAPDEPDHLHGVRESTAAITNGGAP